MPEATMKNTKAWLMFYAVLTLLLWTGRTARADKPETKEETQNSHYLDNDQPRDQDEPGRWHREKLGTILETRNGFVLGAEETTNDGDETWSWKGIPFAQPPERWKAPRPATYWGVLKADTFGSKCPQYDSTGRFSGSEDCLYLNIWRPRTQERNLPVYFYIHGGGNSAGNGGNPMTVGNRLAPRGNMVVVTVNYRLGPLGWFVLPESLRDGNPLDDSGNYGTLDIIRALRWVRANIEAFGGDRDNITIAGESAGGLNVCSLLISPLARHLFHRAISESGGFAKDTVSMDAGRASAQATINTLGCTNPGNLQNCLMSKSPEQLFGAYPRILGGMLDLDLFVNRFTDGVVISSLGKQALQNPKTYNQVPTILGTNKEEFKLFMFGSLWGKMKPADYQAYALSTSMEWQKTGVNDLAAAMTANKGQPDVYAYEFDYGAYNEGGYNAWPDSPYYFDIMIGAAHSLELPFIFGEWTFYGLEPYVFTPGNQDGRAALSDRMVKYWSSFARTGKPRDPNGVHWKPWSNRDRAPKRILFDANATQSLIQMSDQ
jgi:para-nitrobenzyl esterase